MKLFKLSVKKANRSEYNSCVVVAEDKNAVRAMLRYYCPNSKWKHLYVDEKETNVFFYDHQGEITIEEVDLTKPALVCASFNAG